MKVGDTVVLNTDIFDNTDDEQSGFVAGAGWSVIILNIGGLVFDMTVATIDGTIFEINFDEVEEIK